MRSINEQISDVLPWVPTYGCTTGGRLTKTYIHQLSLDSGYSLEKLPGLRDDRNGEREKEVYSRDTLVVARLDDDDDIEMSF